MASYASPKERVVQAELAQAPSMPPGIPMTWSTSKSMPSASGSVLVEEQGSRQESESMNNFMSKMRVKFADVPKKSTAQTPMKTSESEISCIREDLKIIGADVKGLVGVIENKMKILIDKSTQTNTPVKPESAVKIVEVAMPLELHGSLNDSEFRHLGKLQRQFAKEFVESNAEDKQLEVYLKRSAYTDLPGLVFEAEMPGTVEKDQDQSPKRP